MGVISNKHVEIFMLNGPHILLLNHYNGDMSSIMTDAIVI